LPSEESWCGYSPTHCPRHPLSSAAMSDTNNSI
jgi:hypothetical protein